MAGGGGSEPNLTPFIDLFSVLICFLLMTAAWIQLDSMPSSIEKATAGPTPPVDMVTPPNDEKKISLSVTVYSDKILLKENDRELFVQNIGSQFDKEKLKLEFERWRMAYQDKKDVVLNTDALVTYGDLIKMYDLLVASDWPDVGINPQ
ncbi:MAG: biopolymer transporter ExbD [Bdellovibrionaceae bacterium]|nr:biopolymer transporter ExbD [Pseudobdellovibrionaceae bacterium]